MSRLHAGRAISIAALLLLATLGGCLGPRRDLGPVLPPLPYQAAVDVVNQNLSAIHGTLRASGSVDGFFRNDRGRPVSYSVNGVLFYHEPIFLRFDLKKLGDRQLMFGSNATHYWVYTREGDRYVCGRQDDPQGVPADMAIRPDQIPAALGLSPIAAAGGAARHEHRVLGGAQQILFLAHDGRGVEQEYWLDRRAPRLVRRVVFRNPAGAVMMVSELSDYRRLGEGGPFLPYLMVAHWPQENARMEFDVGKWEIVPQVQPDSPQFALPVECLSTSNQ